MTIPPAPTVDDLAGLYESRGWRLPKVARPDLVAIRQGGTGEYDDLIGLWWGDNRWAPVLGTTTPGRWIPGRAVIEPGLHEQVFVIAKHHGREAWTNQGYAMPFRRVARNGLLGPLLEGKYRALNFHDNLGSARDLVGDTSEGCIVAKMGHAEYLDRFVEPVSEDVRRPSVERGRLVGGMALALIEVD